MKARVWLVDDHKIFRKGLRLLVNSMDHFEVVAEAADAAGFLELLEQGQPDLIMLDIAMPGMDGIQAAGQALARFPALRIITLSMYGDPQRYRRALATGVKGFILKSSEVSEIQLALEAVAAGGSYFSPELQRNAMATEREL